MAFLQTDLSDVFQHFEHDSYLIHQFPDLNLPTKESIQQNLQSLLEFKYKKTLQNGDQLQDMTELLQETLNYTLELKSKYEQSPILQQKLRDIEEELQGYFQSKESISEILQDYQMNLQEYKEMQQKVKEMNKNDLPRIEAQNLLQEYSSLHKRLADFATFDNDINDLKKIDERFKILEQEEDYLEHYLILKNKLQDQITLPNTQLLSRFVQMLGQSISYINSYRDCPIIVYYEGTQNIRQEVLMRYKYVIIYKIYDTLPSLILINKEKSDAQIICTSLHRKQNKLDLENYKEYLQNIKPNYILLKPDIILETTYNKIIDNLIQLNIIDQGGNISFQQMLQTINKIILYQQDFEQLDYFQFLDSMQIEFK